MARMMLFPDSNGAGANTTRASGSVPARLAGRRVLVVEDEALTAMALACVLEDAGCEVLGPVGQVEEALALLRLSRPDVAMLDVNLFGRRVWPVAERLVVLGVPFLFCTSMGRGDFPPGPWRAAPIVPKPALARELLATLTVLLDCTG